MRGELTRRSPNLVPTNAARGEAVKRRTVVDLVVDALRTRILRGDLSPGTPLRQEALADELGVSRIPLREAIRHLGSEGLVDLLPHRGAFVTALSAAEVRELFELRLRLEPWLIHEAAGQISEVDLARAEQIAERMVRAPAVDWGTLNWQLHEVLYVPAQRPLAISIVRTLHEKSERYLRFQVVNAPIRSEAQAEHLRLIALCRERKLDAARAVLERHISDAAGQIVEIVGRLLDGPSDRPVKSARSQKKKTVS